MVVEGNQTETLKTKMHNLVDARLPVVVELMMDFLVAWVALVMWVVRVVRVAHVPVVRVLKSLLSLL